MFISQCMLTASKPFARYPLLTILVPLYMLENHYSICAVESEKASCKELGNIIPS
jgi:hypothetical protein